MLARYGRAAPRRLERVEYSVGFGVVPAGLPRAGDVISVTSNDTRIATLAARFGYGFDRALLYGKFGAGWVGNDGFTIVDRTTGAAFTTGSESVSGWMVGAGIEYAFSPNWSA